MSSNQIQKRYRFIPIDREDILSACLAINDSQEQNQQAQTLFQYLCKLMHQDFLPKLDALDQAYAPLDPDTPYLSTYTDKQSNARRFIELLEDLLNRANYERLSEEELNQALAQASLFKIRLQVDFSEFEEVVLYCRGVSERQERVKKWLGLSTRQVNFINFDRVVVYIQFPKLEEESSETIHPFSSEPTLLRLFRNVPKADIEMLFPNTKIRMRLLDKLFIGVPALISGGIVLTTKLGTTLVLLGSLLGFWLGLSSQPVELNRAAVITLGAGLAALAGYLWKQFSNFRNRKIRFMQMLAQDLYFKNLDNNAGVIYRICQEAVEEEIKEMWLAYYFLSCSDMPLTQTELDSKIEAWLDEQFQCKVDFEISDALRKLRDYELIVEQEQKLQALPLSEAIEAMRQRWVAHSRLV